jgi:hypothetical protein
MSSDPHNVIKYLATRDGWADIPGGDHIDKDQFNAVQEAKFVLTAPEWRAQYIDALDTAIGRDDGSTLQKKAQLVELRRRVSRVHENLKRAGR